MEILRRIIIWVLCLSEPFSHSSSGKTSWTALFLWLHARDRLVRMGEFPWISWWGSFRVDWWVEKALSWWHFYSSYTSTPSWYQLAIPHFPTTVVPLLSVDSALPFSTQPPLQPSSRLSFDIIIAILNIQLRNWFFKE